MSEDQFVAFAYDLFGQLLQPPLRVERGANLLYQITVDNRLRVTGDPRRPMRGQSAFQTDLCVFDDVTPDTSLPRVVFEFKKSITTHDVLTYSAKARKHKQIYPYLRYGLVASADATIPRRFFTHNEALDSFLALGGITQGDLVASFGDLLVAEVMASRRLEAMIFGSDTARLFRTAVVFGHESPKPSSSQ